MADESTSSFSGIEEDASSVSDPEQHLKITVDDFLGDAALFGDGGLTTYLNLGAWTPSTTSGTVVNGEFDGGARDTEGKPTPENAYTLDRATGDDLLAAFLYDRYLDDSRDRFDADAVEEENKRAKPAVDFTAFAQPPKVDSFYDPNDPELRDGAGFFPAATDDDHFFFSETARQRLTAYTPATVGWRDHTEGHRVTTTRGDKIEVIGGNYKLIVLGRGSGTVQSDWSGGHRVDVMEAPGLVTSINWRQVPTGDFEDEHGWLWVEETIKGHVIDRFHGTLRTEHYGDEMVSIIGRSDEAAPTAVGTSSDEAGAFELLGEVSRGAERFAESDNPWDGTGGVPPQRSRPKLTRKVHARSVFEREQYDDYRLSIAEARSIDSFTGCRPNLDAEGRVSESGADVSFPDNTWSNKPNIDRDITVAGEIQLVVRASEVREEVRSGYYLAHHSGDDKPLACREYWGGRFNEQFIGSFTQLFAATYITMAIGIRSEICTGVETIGNLGFVAEIKVAEIDVIGGLASYTANSIESRLLKLEAELTALNTTLSEAGIGLIQNRPSLMTIVA